MSSSKFDVVVAGAGLPGLALAAAVARSGLSVALADAAPICAPEYDPDTYDLRVYATSPGSAGFLRAIGAWQALPSERVAAIESMRIEGDAGARLEFAAYDMGERALAWIVEERALRAALVECAHSAGVAMFGGSPFVGLRFSATTAELALENGQVHSREGPIPSANCAPAGGCEAAELANEAASVGVVLSAKLLVGADGLRSWVRRAAGMTAEPRAYGQTGVVANFACERAHHGVARQWFRADGSVLAWLPLPGRRISIVWSAPDGLAADLLALAPEALAGHVGEAGAQALGALSPISGSAGFPLALLRLPTTVAHRLALVGDAAHGVHPLAGQGVNLGFGDALVLAQVLAERGPVADPGASVLLERYARRRAEPVLAMQGVTDGLARLFGARQPWIAAVRNAGLAAVDRMPLLKRALAQPALR